MVVGGEVGGGGFGAVEVVDFAEKSGYDGSLHEQAQGGGLRHGGRTEIEFDECVGLGVECQGVDVGVDHGCRQGDAEFGGNAREQCLQGRSARGG